MSEVMLSGAARTPIGSFQGALAAVSAATLGSRAIAAVLRRAAIPADAIDAVLIGNVIGAGQGQNIARQAALGAGLPVSTPATTVNKVCGSGLESVIIAARTLRCGDADLIVAGGTESMTQAPYLLPKARDGYRLGHAELVDSLLRDGLWDIHTDQHMGACGDNCAATAGIDREDQDDFAVASYQRALAATEAGAFTGEIEPVDIVQRKGVVSVTEDEEPARFNELKLRSLRPVFSPNGTITPGNASTISDGAAAILAGTADAFDRHHITPQARLVGQAAAARLPGEFPLAPIDAIRRLLDRLDWQPADVELWEINEAFAMVPLAAIRALDLDPERVNVNGGAVSLGHPIGASGARILVTLLHALAAKSARRGIAAICIGGGEALAVAVER